MCAAVLVTLTTLTESPGYFWKQHAVAACSFFFFSQTRTNIFISEQELNHNAGPSQVSVFFDAAERIEAAERGQLT